MLGPAAFPAQAEPARAARPVEGIQNNFVPANAGTTVLPQAASAGRATLWHFHLGASGIFAATADPHFLLEAVGNWIGPREPGRSRARDVAARRGPDWGAFFDASFAHRLGVP